MHFECVFLFWMEGQPTDTMPDLGFPFNHITELPFNFSLKNTATEEVFRRDTENNTTLEGNSNGMQSTYQYLLSFEYFCTAEEKKKKGATL